MSKLQTSYRHEPQTNMTRVRSGFQFRDNGLGFSPITLIVHWIVAAVLLSILAIEVVRFFSPSVETTRVLNLLGAVLFPISIYRFWARVTSYHPLPLGTPNPVELIISRSVALGLALAMALLPLAAWLTKSADGEPIELPGRLFIPSLIPQNHEAAQIFGILFDIGATAFLLGFALHIFGACKNHFVLKNDTLKRMLGKHVEL
jgi:superoxide oxidase